jgi:hypothetical protein
MEAEKEVELCSKVSAVRGSAVKVLQCSEGSAVQ